MCALRPEAQSLTYGLVGSNGYLSDWASNSSTYSTAISMSSGFYFSNRDLRVMSRKSYQTAPPRVVKSQSCAATMRITPGHTRGKVKVLGATHRLISDARDNILKVVNTRSVVYTFGMGKFDPAPTLAAGLLRLAREKANMTQSALAAEAGVSQQSISAYETGRKEPTLPTLQRLLAAAGLEMRIRLEPIDYHDTTLEAFLETLSPARQAELAAQSRLRVEAERLSRIRGQ